jgi:hypothetical protein
LLGVCLVASAVLLCHSNSLWRGSEIPGLSAPYRLIYTAEGLPGDVAAELAEARRILEAGQAVGISQVEELSGSDVWATFLNEASTAGMTLRAGVAPRDLPGVLGQLASVLGGSAFAADLANGLLYLQTLGELDHLQAVRRLASAHNGYAIVLSAADMLDARLDRWGYAPDSLALMRTLKARWDPQGLLNRGVFLPLL